MNDNVLLLHGMECSKCTRPAKSHNFRTGQTVHLSPGRESLPGPRTKASPEQRR